MKSFQHLLCFSCRTVLGLAVALVAVLFAPAALHATSFTYDFNLTSTNSSYNGTGSFTVTSAVPASGQVTYNGGTTLTALSFSIDGEAFNLAQDSSALVRTLNDSINDITFAGTDGVGVNSFTLDSTGSFAFYYHNGVGQSVADYGNFTNLTLVPGAVAPEPSGLILLGTGAIGIAGATRRRFLRA